MLEAFKPNQDRDEISEEVLRCSVDVTVHF